MSTPKTSPRWLTDGQQGVWRAYLLGAARLTERLDADLRQHDLDLPTYEILVCLEEADNRQLRMSELADAAHQSRSRLTHTIARMERRGLVERAGCPSDRRGVWAQLTAAGVELLSCAAPDHVACVRRNFVDAVAPADFVAVGRAFRAVLDVSVEDPKS